MISKDLKQKITLLNLRNMGNFLNSTSNPEQSILVKIIGMITMMKNLGMMNYKNHGMTMKTNMMMIGLSGVIKMRTRLRGLR